MIEEIKIDRLEELIHEMMIKIRDTHPTNSAEGNPIEIENAAAAPLVKCITEIHGSQSGSGTPSPDNIRPIVAYTEGEIEVSDGDGNTTTHTATFSQSIYQGNADFVGGKVECYMPVIDLGDLTWTKDGNNFRAPVTGMKRPASAGIPGNGVCSHYPIVPQSASAANTISFLGWMDGIIFWGDGTYETVEAFTAAIVGVKLAYELATPTTEAVTPSNLPIKSLSGYNHIESSTGDMEVTYITEEFEPLVPTT